ncbi:MAG: metal ABC transporter substrate-binding protein [Sphingomonadales bacterium]
MNRFAKFLILALVCVAPASANAALKVVATTQDLAAIARAVGGEDVKVTSLTPGTRDPHFADAKPSMIRRVHDADLLLLIGADMEIGWLPPLIQSARNTKIQPGGPGYLDLSMAVVLTGRPSGTITRAMGDVHAKGNPHYWLSPRNGLRMATAIAARLSQLDPGHAGAYQARLDAFSRQLMKKIAAWKMRLKPLRGRPVIAYHTSFVYLAHAFGFKVVDEVEPKPGIPPSAAYLNLLIKRIRAENIDLLIMEPYYERRSATYLKDQTGIQVVVVPQSVGSMPRIDDYFDLFDAIVAVFVQTLDT